MHDRRLEQIETKIAFLEQANATLSDEVLHQKALLLKLQNRMEQLTASAGTDKDASIDTGEERPPHY